MTYDTEKISALFALNLSLSAFQAWAVYWEPTFRALAPLGQLAVAIVTVIFIVKKIFRKKKNKDE